MTHNTTKDVFLKSQKKCIFANLLQMKNWTPITKKKFIFEINLDFP